MKSTIVQSTELFSQNNPQHKISAGFGMLVLALKASSVNNSYLPHEQAFELFKEASTTSTWSSSHRDALNKLTMIGTAASNDEATALVSRFTGYKVTPDREKAFKRFVDALLFYYIKIVNEKYNEVSERREHARLLRLPTNDLV